MDARFLLALSPLFLAACPAPPDTYDQGYTDGYAKAQDDFEDRLAGLEATVTSLQGQVDTCATDEEVAALQAEIDQFGLAFTSIAEFTALSGEVAALTTTVSTLATSTGQAVSELETDVGIAQRDIGDLDARLDSVESDVSAIGGDYATATALGALDGRVTTLDGRVTTLEGTSATAASVTALDTRVSAIEADYATGTDLDALTDIVADVEASIPFEEFLLWNDSDLTTAEELELTSADNAWHAVPLRYTDCAYVNVQLEAYNGSASDVSLRLWAGATPSPPSSNLRGDAWLSVGAGNYGSDTVWVAMDGETTLSAHVYVGSGFEYVRLAQVGCIR